MPDAFTLALRDWQSFYVLTGTAAATLMGLVFVAISLGARLVPTQSTSSIRAFVAPTVMHFGAVLVLAALLLIPTHTALSLGAALALAGLAGLGYSLKVARHMALHHEQQPLDTHHWLWHLLVPTASYVLTLGTGLGLLTNAGWALDALALAVLALIVVGMRNAFDLMLWIAQQPV